MTSTMIIHVHYYFLKIFRLVRHADLRKRQETANWNNAQDEGQPLLTSDDTQTSNILIRAFA